MILYIAVPCYNEQEVLPQTNKALVSKLKALIQSNTISPDSKILYVNDGSSDATWSLINKYNEGEYVVSGINLSSNRGHENALMAGLMFSKDRADCVISLDADLQDDINAIDEMLIKFKRGADIVFGVRKSRKTDSFFKRTTAHGFYRLMTALGAKTIPDHANYRLMSKRALQNLSQYKEVNLFLRGIVPQLGYTCATVYYDRRPRGAGETKYPLGKMLIYAIEGITSFSIKPIRVFTALGMLISALSFIAIIYCIITKFVGYTVDGWTSLSASIWFLGGVQLLGIGVIGEYIGKIYTESKHRPRYFIQDVLENTRENDEDFSSGRCCGKSGN